MGSILLQAIKLAPRLLWQSYAQPSKAYDFFSQNKMDSTIFIWSGFFSGLVLGSMLAIPHYFLYHNISLSILFAVAFALTLAVAFAVAIEVAFKGAGAAAVTFAVAGAIAFAVAGAGAFTVAGAAAVAAAVSAADVLAEADAEGFGVPFATAEVWAIFRGAYFAISLIIITSLGFILSPAIVTLLLSLSAAGWLIMYLNNINKIKLKNDLAGLIIFVTGTLMLLAAGEGMRLINLYEMIIYPLAFCIVYSYYSSFGFIKGNRKFKESFKTNMVKNDDVTHQKFLKIQTVSLLWGSIIGFILCSWVYRDITPELNEKILIAGLGFAVMPLFILHIPDYLISLPLWFYQKRKILKKNYSAEEIASAYENSFLFKHEMLFIELPGLHKIMVSMAGNKEIGIKKTVKRINDLYWYTFQQKQAQKAITTLGKAKEITHQCIHLLLEGKNVPLVKTLAEVSRLAGLYSLLIEENIRFLNIRFLVDLPVKPTEFIAQYRIFKMIKLRRKEVQQILLRTLPERIDFVCREMEKESGYHLNSEMIHTFRFAQKLLASGGLKDFSAAVEILDNTKQYPREIDYFTAFETMAAQLKKIKADLLKIETIERFETKRYFLSQQKESIEALTKATEDSFYEPFRTLWQEALMHCAGLVEKEIKLLQGSAVLAIDLKNREILVPGEGRYLYFIIHNKGRELADNVVITLRTGIPLIDFNAGSEAKIDIIEAGTVKEIAFPIAALAPGKTTVQGIITFSDPTWEAKTLDFSFPLTLAKKRTEFKEIENPYIVGQPLPGNTPLYFGREDAYTFIDKNITASGTHHTIVCHGLRRTGKSSLLYRIETRGFTNPRLVPIFIDMQGIDNEKDFYATVSGKIREKLSQKPCTTAVAVDSFSHFKEFLKEIEPVLGAHIMVLLVDEFEELQMRVEDNRISRTIFSNIRHLMQHEEKLSFLFCGTHKLEEMSAYYWSIFFNTALYLRLSRLKDQDAVRLIREPVKGQLDYDDLAVEQILKMTGGQPYLVQLLCRTLVNNLNDTKKRNDAMIDDVDEAVEEIITGGTENFSQYIWDQSNSLERLLMSAAAEEMTRRQLDYIGLETLCGQVEGVAKTYSRKQMLDALEKLVSREILEEKDMRYRFPVNLLRKLLAARFPLRKVREEI